MKKIIKNPLFLITMIIVLVVSAILKDSLTNQVYAVTLKVDGEIVELESNSDDVESLFIENSIDVSGHDKLSVDKEDPLEDGMVIEIERAKQVNIKRGDEYISLFTHSEKVSGVLKEAGIDQDEYAVSFPTEDSTIENGLLITVYDELKEDPEAEKYAVSIEPEVIYQEDSSLEKGSEVVVQEGKAGRKEFEFFPGDPEFDLSAGVISEEAEPRIIAQGTYEAPVVTASAAESSSSSSYSASESSAPSGSTMIFEATAYNLIGTTRSGVPSGPGKVAVDPNVIPLGTRLYIESTDGWPDYGYAIAADTGGAIKGHIIDLFYYDYDTCINFGRRNIKVTILD